MIVSEWWIVKRFGSNIPCDAVVSIEGGVVAGCRTLSQR